MLKARGAAAKEAVAIEAEVLVTTSLYSSTNSSSSYSLRPPRPQLTASFRRRLLQLLCF